MFGIFCVYVFVFYFGYEKMVFFGVVFVYFLCVSLFGCGWWGFVFYYGVVGCFEWVVFVLVWLLIVVG